MEQYIEKSALVAEVESKKKCAQYLGDKAINGSMQQFYDGMKQGCVDILSFLNTLKVKDPYEQCVQYDSIKAGIEAHAETYSFNIESELFNQLTKEQQALWRKEIEQAVISGGDAGVTLARDQRYKENLEVKEVENTELLKLRGYLVRDKDDYTSIHAEKPHRGKTEWVDGNNSCLITINDARLVSDLEFDDEPVEVEVTLKRV